MTSRIRGYVRDPSSGAGVNPATVYVKKHSDNSTVASDATDANGLYEIGADTVGYPGEVYETVTVGSDTKVRSGRVWGQLGGLIWASDVPDALALMGIGVASGLTVSADGSDMNVDIAAGVALLKDGCPYILEAADDLTIGTADATNPRIDRIILRLTREGQTDQGKISLMVLAGTAAASPSAPSLTQTSATWDLSLAQVLVGTGVTTIAANKVTDERSYCFSYPSGITAGDIFYVNASGVLTRLAKGTANNVLTQGATIPAWSSTITSPTLVTPTLSGGSKATGTNPTAAVNTSVAGTGASVTVNYGNDTSFQLTITAGSSGFGTGRIVTVSFAAAKVSTNYNVLIQEASSDAVANEFRPTNRTTTDFEIHCASAPTAAQSIVLQVLVIEDV